MNLSEKKNVYLFAVLILIFITLACGSSTTERLEEAISPTTANEGVTSEAEENSPQEVETQPTNAVSTEMIEATEIPPTDVPPTEIPSPTAPPPTATPEPEPINVIAQGFGQDGRSVGYSFVIENPNSGLSFEDSQYQLAALDDSGAIVDTDSGFITIVLPEQKLGVSGSFFVEEDVVVAEITVQVNAGDAISTEIFPNFTVESATYFGGDFSEHATGIINSPYDRSFTDLKVSAVLYNASDEIVGGGFTFLNFILAGGSTGVEISVTSAGEVARVEIYPVLSGLSLLGNRDGEIPEGMDAPVVQKQGFGQDDRSIGYGILIMNPNPDQSIEDSQFQITFYSENNEVLATDGGYINLLLPGQTLGIGGSEFVDDGQVISRVEAQILPGDFIELTEELLPFGTDNVTFNPGTFSSNVSGFILNPYSQDITDLRVSAIAYNENGDIIGGGFTFLDFAAANSQSAVEVSVDVSEVPATVELYAVSTILSEFE